MFNGLIRFTGTTLCAGVLVEDDKVISTGGGLGFMRGWSTERTLEFAKRRRWQVELMADAAPADV
jgi:hypothetical protein